MVAASKKLMFEGRKYFFKLCQYLCGFIWIQLCTQSLAGEGGPSKVLLLLVTSDAGGPVGEEETISTLQAHGQRTEVTPQMRCIPEEGQIGARASGFLWFPMGPRCTSVA